MSEVWHYPLLINDMSLVWKALKEGRLPGHYEELIQSLKATANDGGASIYGEGRNTEYRRVCATRLLFAIMQFLATGEKPRGSFKSRAFSSHAGRRRWIGAIAKERHAESRRADSGDGAEGAD